MIAITAKALIPHRAPARILPDLVFASQNPGGQAGIDFSAQTAHILPGKDR
jgi:hypothetical protein